MACTNFCCKRYHLLKDDFLLTIHLDCQNYFHFCTVNQESIKYLAISKYYQFMPELIVCFTLFLLNIN